MKRNFILKSWIVLVLCFFGCGEDEKPAVSVKLLSISVDQSFNTSDTENWIIIHDDVGKLIEYRSFESGDDITIETTASTPENTIGVTFLKLYFQDDFRFYNLETYLNIEKGETLKVANFQTSVDGQLGGTFDIVIDGFTSFDQSSTSNKFGFGCGGSSGSVVDLTCGTIDSATKYILQLSDKSGDLRYKVLEDVEVDDSYRISFYEMEPFDTTIEFVFPESTDVDLTISGREAGFSYFDFGYSLNNHVIDDAHTQIKAGYLNSLTKYSTELSVGYPDFKYVYSIRGSIPDPNISWPSKADFSLSSKLLQDFSSDVKTSFNWRKSIWTYEGLSSPTTSHVTWQIFSKSVAHKLSELPAEIVSQHPVIAFENLKHSSTTFYTESEPYIDHIKRTLNEEDAPVDAQIGISIW